MRRPSFASTTLPIAIGWSIGWGISYTVASASACLGIWGIISGDWKEILIGLASFALVAVAGGVGWAIGGVNTGLILWWKYPFVHWKHTLVMVFGWVVNGVIGFPVLVAMTLAIGIVAGLLASGIVAQVGPLFSVLAMALFLFLCLLSFLMAWFFSGVVVGIVGGAVTGLTLRWSEPSLRWGRALLIIGCWAFCLIVAWLIGWIVSGVAWSFLGIGEDVLVGDLGQAVKGTILVGAGGAVGGAIGGVVGGGMASAVMFWQLGQICPGHRS